MIQLFSDFNLALLFATINMATALMLGAIIGSERQFRGRMAGLRTNALVSLGAAGFVVFAALFPTDINPTRVAAQVVSGIGFLGAGIIFRDGLTIQGLNTAATLWCSAAVGLISGTGHLMYAIALTGLIVFSNLGLRPLVRRLKAASAKAGASEEFFCLTFECSHEVEKDIRAALVACLEKEPLQINRISSRSSKNAVEISAQLKGPRDATSNVEKIISKMSLNAGLLRAQWAAGDDVDEDTH
ncbi:MgtC/SapB transporter [Sulfitobacter donghicola DSW-25 = KCTC 12864 = JCM 14565]|nr:MgtC/SapB transporter [Sulfitobacter donghicola DSW-25 = KCTC 12864 = JCM 14565]